MHVLSILNHKGGVGKTTTALNLAATLATDSKRVLLLDMDSQCSASLAMGLSRKQLASGPSTADVLFNKRTIQDACYHNVWPNIDLIPASLDLAHAGLSLDATSEGAEHLKQALSTAEIASTYHAVLIDCPPALSVVTQNALLASSDLLIPTRPSPLSFEGLKSLGQLVKKMRDVHGASITLLGIVITQMIQGRPESARAVRSLRDHYHHNVFETVIPEDNAVEQALQSHQPLTHFAPHTEASIRYNNLAEEITQRWEEYDSVLHGIRAMRAQSAPFLV